MTVTDEDIQRMRRILLHAVQVGEGLIPEDSPDEFTIPGDPTLPEGE